MVVERSSDSFRDEFESYFVCIDGVSLPLRVSSLFSPRIMQTLFARSRYFRLFLAVENVNLSCESIHFILREMTDRPVIIQGQTSIEILFVALYRLYRVDRSSDTRKLNFEKNIATVRNICEETRNLLNARKKIVLRHSYCMYIMINR